MSGALTCEYFLKVLKSHLLKLDLEPVSVINSAHAQEILFLVVGSILNKGCLEGTARTKPNWLVPGGSQGIGSVPGLKN